MSNVIFGVPNLVRNVRDFHIKYGIDYKGPVRNLPEDIKKATLKHLKEELRELKKGLETDNREEILDACIDLIYVTLGTAHLHGFNFNKAWERVHRANMSKIRKSTKRSPIDIVKPRGWKPPLLKDLV